MSTHALLGLVEEISNALDNKKYATGVFSDQKKAFDTVDLHILANKINLCGVILINDKLTWINHISLVKSKLSKCCAIM